MFAIILVPTVFLPAKAQEDLVYVAVEPCRLVDTRVAGGVITANNFRNFRVSGTLGELAVQGGKTDCLDPKAGTGLEPLAISAYVITVPATTTNSILTAYPSDQLPPPVGAGSTVNSATGQVIGNTTNVTLCDSASCPADGEFAILARNTNQHVVVDVQGYFYPTTLGRCPSSVPTRFIDNGDGTICDNQTGLMWEKKDSSDGAGNTGNPNDVDNAYSWTMDADPGSAPTGTIYIDLLPQLNNSWDGGDPTVGFAGYTDWRIPTMFELETILLEPNPCSISPCIDATFGPTAENVYWSSTSWTSEGTTAFVVDFRTGESRLVANKLSAFPVRAVRGGR